MSYRDALEQIATGRITGGTAAENLAVCRDIAQKALASPACDPTPDGETVTTPDKGREAIDG